MVAFRLSLTMFPLIRACLKSSSMTPKFCRTSLDSIVLSLSIGVIHRGDNMPCLCGMALIINHDCGQVHISDLVAVDDFNIFDHFLNLYAH